MAFEVLTMDTITDLVEFASGATLSEGHRRLVRSLFCFVVSTLHSSCCLGAHGLVLVPNQPIQPTPKTTIPQTHTHTPRS